MNILIIEDEMLAAERLKMLINQYDPGIKIEPVLESIEESVHRLKTKPHPELLLMDIHLSDGHSFEIFKQVDLQRPVIFTTAYDDYAIDAFRHFSIDYILKPVTAQHLANAIHKYRTISSAFYPPDYNSWATQWKVNSVARYKDRFLAKLGTRSIFINAEDIACFQADNKIVYLIDREGNRFVINYTLEKLEPLLDPYHFFRINRKMIVHSKVIDVVKQFYNGRLKLMLKNINLNEDILVSRERVNDFRKWAEGGLL